MGAESNLNIIVELCAAVRQVHPEMTVSQLQVLAIVVTNPGISMAQIAERTGLMEGSVSRIVSLLSQYGSRSAKGYGSRSAKALNLFQMDQDADDRRFRTLTVTPKGKRLVDQLAGLLSYKAKDVRPA